ncbi:MAG: cbb3-type cytochrome oxidase assembly protein CcoS [Verrucomicrobia bacterium]|nr:cbb3-type cytochrome oxidase assembly protein CcoS [Verrucomicrobiota bacterium]
MSAIFILIPLSIVIAMFFLIAFIWAVRSGQYDDTCTPSLRVLLDDTRQQPRPRKSASRVSPHPVPLPKERESASIVSDNHSASNSVAARSLILPLPEGEDRGEGQAPEDGPFHDPGKDGFHPVPDFTQRSEEQDQGRGGTRPYQFMVRAHVSKAVEPSP